MLYLPSFKWGILKKFILGLRDNVPLLSVMITFANVFACTIFLFCAIRLAIYLPVLFNTATQYLPGYKEMIDNHGMINDSYEILFGRIGLGNPMLIFSTILMIFNGIILFAFTEDTKNKSIWFKTVIAAFSIFGVLVTVFSVRGI